MMEQVIKDVREFGEKTGIINKRVLVLYSGGIDSSVTLYVLKKAGFKVSALTFFHKWSWPEVLRWGMKFTKSLNVEHYLIDITDALLRRAVGRKGPICIHCKKVMLENAKWFALNNNFSYLAKGDNANDKIIGTLLDQCPGDIRLCEIPKIGIPIFRPLVKYKADFIQKLADEAKIKPYRMYEHGRRRQWREGCPLQYIDEEERITPELMDLAFRVNYEVSKIARKRKVRISVRVPSFEVMCWDCNDEVIEEVRKALASMGT
ncbi:ATP pyrophosphatase [Pyrococcus furiosus DSM 3638]|uniref:N-type ATP pyrophosphatase superfamily n=2 Tax=Pyrococcus furiosus (strain ATCC 43587 / DSM 3638 / JCM 8422 / Vc1) TaxID=186497 RepID=Q8U0G7_PYRFU|nr:7-cyano-7-deazaguanine synthase [Pyrococcus furiosus]AAL81746.1 n-type ATP pyrophosphatase superfamily [Pyrococcus furiosus DSM 3638]QEK79244.1 ATP pyrophosphatase [Pyrococcus furiosus DSM 3638]